MKEEETLKTLQYYRHDIMNHLQIISGYLSIGKIEKASEKMGDLIEQFNQERKLMATNAPQFILWLLMINHVETNVRVRYHLQPDIHLLPIDEQITNHCKQIIAILKRVGKQNVLYDVEIRIKNTDLQMEQVKVVWHITGKINLDALLLYIDREQIDLPIHFAETENGIDGMITYYLSE